MSTQPKQSAWLVPLNRPLTPIVRLICLPAAGSSATQFLELARLLPGTIDCIAVEYPGHGRRWGEPLIPNVHRLAAGLAAAIKELPGLPFCLFGHSMGSLVAFETAHLLARAGEQGPCLVVASAHRGPQTPPIGPRLTGLPDSELIAKLREMNGTSADVLANRELLELVLPIFRADVEADETYVRSSVADLGVAIAAYGGLDDPFVPEGQLDEWSRVTSRAVNRRRLPGDHFYFQSHPDGLASALMYDVMRALADEEVRPT